MQSQTYLYRLGDGNEGNYPRCLLTLSATDDPYAALAALVENRYIAGRRVRNHIVRKIQTEGEPEFGILATVYEGPDGEQAFEAAWITAELEPLKPEDVDHYEGQSLQHFTSMRDAVDAPAYRRYRAALKARA